MYGNNVVHYYAIAWRKYDISHNIVLICRGSMIIYNLGNGR